MVLQFPDDFFWGSSTSAAQVETASLHNWKGIKTRDGHLFDRTTDHEQRRDEDIEYIAQFGTVYRCSVDWARLQSSVYAPFDPEVVEEYQVFFDLLAQRGVKIMFVLHHFANPVWFENRDGWLNEENVSAYVDFVRQCVEHFGKYVFNWNTFNEPNVYVLNAYLLGNFPPFKKNYFKAGRVLKNLGRAHTIAYKIIKEVYPLVPVGISLNTAYFKGLNWLGKIPAWLTDWWFHKRAARPFRMVDYWGLSYYAYVPFDPIPLTEIEHPGRLDRHKIPHDKMWGYFPEGLGIALRRFWKKYKKPLIVTENGICTDDPKVRIQAIKDYLHVCHQVLKEDIPIQGYIFWSTWDNFEWHLGPTYRFGLVEVNPETRDRKMTEAGNFYHKVTQTNTVNLQKNCAMQRLLLCCFLLASFQAFAQNGLPPTAGARSAAMGGSGLNFTDINSIFSNQAGLADLDGLSFTLVGENRFLLSEIRSLSAGAALPSKLGTFGLSMNYYGFDLYNEQRIGLAYARKLMNRLSIGAQFIYLNTNIPDYGNAANFTFELGLQAKLSKSLSLGVHTFNPGRVKLIEDERLPTLLSVGMQYQPSDKLFLLAEVEKDLDYTVRTRFGAEYQLIEQLWLRLGVATQPVEYTFGLGYTLKNSFRIDISARYHQVLGFSPGIGITYTRAKGEDKE